jgi:hypothetical protein
MVITHVSCNINREHCGPSEGSNPFAGGMRVQSLSKTIGKTRCTILKPKAFQSVNGRVARAFQRMNQGVPLALILTVLVRHCHDVSAQLVLLTQCSGCDLVTSFVGSTLITASTVVHLLLFVLVTSFLHSRRHNCRRQTILVMYTFVVLTPEKTCAYWCLFWVLNTSVLSSSCITLCVCGLSLVLFDDHAMPSCWGALSLVCFLPILIFLQSDILLCRPVLLLAPERFALP